MGLDFSHGDAHWAYSSFMFFREEIAKREGIELRRMDGFTQYWVVPSISWDTVTTPLKPLLDHSDCDGTLSPEECRQVAPRLREVVSEVFPEGDYNYAQGMALADGMDMAADAGELFEFC